MSTKHTPAPWVLEIRKGLGDASREATVAEIGTSGKYRGNVAYMQSAEHIDGIGRDELIANARLIAAAPDLKAVAANFEITGPDDDGLVWLHLYGQGTTGKAMFQLGSPDRVAVQVALLLEGQRKAAIAKAEGRS